MEDTSPGPGGAWVVDDETGGVELRDYWFYVRGRRVFDLVLRNPDSVKLYRLTPQQYVAELAAPTDPWLSARGCCERVAAAPRWQLSMCCNADLLAPSKA